MSEDDDDPWDAQDDWSDDPWDDAEEEEPCRQCGGGIDLCYCGGPDEEEWPPWERLQFAWLSVQELFGPIF